MFLSHDTYLMDKDAVEKGLDEAVRQNMMTAEEAETQRLLWHEKFEDLGAIALGNEMS